MSVILYIHGFASSPTSTKAKELKYFYKDKIVIPELKSQPFEDFTVLNNLIVNLEKPIIVGSSLGGFYAEFFSKKYSLKSVLINPLLNINLIKKYIGINKYYYSDGYFNFTNKDYLYLLDLESQLKLNNNEYVEKNVLLAKDDDIIPYNLAVDYYKSTSVNIKIYHNLGHGFANTSEVIKSINQINQ